MPDDLKPGAAMMASTGIAGLDDVLCGGLTAGNVFLLEGTPGTGKTTIALDFLKEGAKQGEPSLYIALSETDGELRRGAASHGWTLPGNINVFELLPPESVLEASRDQTLLYSSDLELGEATKSIFQEFERVKPKRVVLDSLSEIRLLAQSSLRYRRQLLALKHYFSRTGSTVLLLDDLTSEADDKTAHSIVHGVIRLEVSAPTYGADRRRLRIIKYRGHAPKSGCHDFTIKTGGVTVFPRLVSGKPRTDFDRAPLKSGISELDALLGGGIERGSGSLILGPAGTGKSLITIQFVTAAIARGEKAAMFIFDEELGALLQRMRGMGFDLEALQESGALHLEQVDATALTPGEFAQRVQSVVDGMGAKTVVIDSLNGYQAAMNDEHAVILHIHELLQYLNRQGANTFVTVAQHGLVGTMDTPIDVTYLADTVILLRYFEAAGEVRRAISVIKKRTGKHETTIREYRISPAGLALGEPLDHFQGVLQGVPTYVGQSHHLMSGPDGSRGL